MQDNDVQPRLLTRRACAGRNGDRQPGTDVLAGIGATDDRSTRAGRSEYKDDHHILSAKGPNDPAAFEPAMA